MNNVTIAGRSTAFLSDIVVTDCADHGVVVARDYATARECIIGIEDCRKGLAHDADAHRAAEVEDGENCWFCCDKVQIDPLGVFDH